MSLPVFISDTVATAGEHVTVTGPEGRHAVTVKRIVPGERVMLIDGHGTARTCQVTAVSGRDRMDVVAESVAVLPSPSPRLTIVRARPKRARSNLSVAVRPQAGSVGIVAWQTDRTSVNWPGK